MKTFNTKFLFLLFCMTTLLTTTFAQQAAASDKEDKKKIVIITKKVDGDGKVITEKTVKDASEAEVIFIESDESEIELGKEMNVNVQVEEEAGNKQVKIKIIKDGTAEVIEWKGNGDLPEDLQRELAEKGVQVHTLDEDQTTIIGNANKFKFRSSPKACLGVRIGRKITVENINGEETEVVEGFSDDGVSILGIIEDSGAAAAGLLKDDVITAINDQPVTVMEDLSEALGSLDPGTTVSINYLRDGVASQTDAVLGDCSTNMNFAEIEEVIEEEIEISGDARSTTNKMVIIKRIDGEPNEIIEWNEDIENVEPPTLAFKNTLELERLDVFPNPTDGLLRVQFTAPQQATTVRVIDTSGKEIYRNELNNFNGNFNEEIDLQKAAKGTLILSIQQGDKVFSEKIILQ